jgi:hypothetical protein
MLDSVLFYLGVAAIFVGLLMSVQTRWVGAILVAVGALLAIGALALPVRTKRINTHTLRLDDWMPVWQFDERHVIQINAPPEKVFTAIRAVRAKEILFFRMLTAIRRCGRPGPESILNAPEDKPLLDVATQTTFLLLTNEPSRELVLGTVITAPSGASASGKLTPELFRKTLKPGVVLAAMNFFVRPDEHGGSIVSSETRVYANDASGVRRFAIYWRIIHPGSDIIRRMWLRAIKLRAEGQSSLS